MSFCFYDEPSIKKGHKVFFRKADAALAKEGLRIINIKVNSNFNSSGYEVTISDGLIWSKSFLTLDFVEGVKQSIAEQVMIGNHQHHASVQTKGANQ